MPFLSLALSSDSLIVAVALSAVLTPRHIVPVIALFGICDAGASMLGPAMGVQMPVASVLAPIYLVLWGGLIMLNLPAIVLWHRPVYWAYLLPPLLAIDNLVAPSGAPVAAGFASSGMAAVGFGLGFALLRRSGSGAPKHRRIGAALAAAGFLLTA
jgi:hypothetical protein